MLKVGKELSFQVNIMRHEHTCVPFNFEKGKRHMTRAWMVKNYMEAFRDNLMLRARDLRAMIKKQHNYNVNLLMCIGLESWL